MKSKYVVSLAAFSLLAASSAFSAITVYATNCVKGNEELKINVSAYNGKDNIKAWPYDSEYKLAYGSTASLKCKAQGKGRYKIYAKVDSGSMDDWQNIDKSEYAYVVKEGDDLKIYEKTFETTCTD